MKKWNRMFRIRCVFILAVGFLLLPVICCAGQDGPVATVSVAPIKMGTISQTVIAYGTIIPAPGAAEMISVPYESQVRKVLVRPGEQVSSGDPLIEIAPSPDTQLKVNVAKTAYETARKRLDDIKKKKRLKLATNDEVLQAQEAFLESEFALKNFRKMGAMDQRVLKAAHKGVVGKVFEQEGAVVTPGGPLVKIIEGGALECLLGGEAEDGDLFKPGQTVSLSPVNRPGLPPISGRIRIVSHSIDPTTRLIDIFVVPDDSDGFLLNEYVKGEITIASTNGLIVPRSAMLKVGDRFRIFTVKNNRAIQHFVRPGIQNEKEVQIFSADLKAGDLAVILGNYELEDGMTVKVEEPK